ncbi:hypothetical protein MPLSOD_340163 [Mesorhizobium sp. SOD10]|nr:hypothetical protein MPLSOD_340163 [Mesorhizobium sp. SOD10]
MKADTLRLVTLHMLGWEDICRDGMIKIVFVAAVRPVSNVIALPCRRRQVAQCSSLYNGSVGT